MRWWPFALLLIFGASRWAVSAARPETGSTPLSQAIGCAWATLVACAYLIPGRESISPQTRRPVILRWLLAGALMAAGPGITLWLPGRDVDAGALTMALALTPVIIAIASSAFGTESSDGIAGRIWPGLASVAGLLLVLVQPSLGDLRSDIALLLAPSLTGMGSVLFCIGTPRAAARVSTALVGASALFALALAMTILSTHARPAFSLLAIGGDGILSLLSVLALNELGATRWSSQFTLIPLLVILESIVLVRPELTAHWVIGLILLIAAGVYLLLPQVDEAAADASPIPTLPR